LLFADIQYRYIRVFAASGRLFVQDFGILLLGCARPLHIAEVLEGLKRQDALAYVHVWIDGHQGDPELKKKTEKVANVVSGYAVAEVYRHQGNLGFRKLILQALTFAVREFKHILVLEDDCFPTRDAVRVFQNELRILEGEPDIFSVYGHYFLTESETDTCSRFQGWGWGTTSDKLKPVLAELIECYSLSEAQYLEFVTNVLTSGVVARLDVTPPRQPTHTLTKFFAWDETLALLTALRGWNHRKTPSRVIYNFGVGLDASHFKYIDLYRQPPFNMISIDKLWDYY
jgi:hypothetical protein